MKIVLRSDVKGLGGKGDIRDVAKGYARNYLMPRGLAIKSSSDIAEQAKAMRRAARMVRAADQADAEAIAVRLAPTVIEVSAKATNAGHLYGSVTAEHIVAAVKDQIGAIVEPKSVVVDTPIRDTGTHSVLFCLHEKVEVPVAVSVTAE